MAKIKKKKPKLTPNREQYIKQVKRIKNAAKRLEKKGYTVDVEKAINEIAVNPKRITKNILRELSKLTPKKLKTFYTEEKPREIEYPSTPDIPDFPENVKIFDIVEEIKERINEAGRVWWQLEDNLTDIKQMLINLFNEEIEHHEDNGTSEEYIEYLETNSDAIFSAVDNITEARYNEDVTSAAYHLANILTQGDIPTSYSDLFWM